MSIDMSKAFVIQPLSEQYRPIYDLIRAAASKAGVTVFNTSSLEYGTNLVDAINKAISDSDFLIVDVSESNPNIMLNLGFARGKEKPIILIACSSKNIPYDLAGQQLLIYDIVESDDFVARLSAALAQAAKTPDAYSLAHATSKNKERHSVFISYSHADVAFYDRLLIHLKPLERERSIEVWADTRIRAGDKWHAAIEGALSRATVAVLLVSADFLASDFIINDELPTILRKAEGTGTRIISLILKPCGFTRERNLRQFQAINSPEKSLIMLSEGEKEFLYDRVAAEVENISARG